MRVLVWVCLSILYHPCRRRDSNPATVTMTGGYRLALSTAHFARAMNRASSELVE